MTAARSSSIPVPVGIGSTGQPVKADRAALRVGGPVYDGVIVEETPGARSDVHAKTPGRHSSWMPHPRRGDSTFIQATAKGSCDRVDE